MSQPAALPQHLHALGFERNPFPQTPDADCYFRTEAIEQQFTEALHCVKAGKGFVLLTGEVGTGKSTFLRCLMDDLVAGDCAVSFVFNTFLQGRDLLLAINRDFGLAAGTHLAEDIDRLNQFLIAQHGAGRCCVVVIDDAQNLDAASLELIRLLSNLETRQNKLLQIVLSGQPELLTLLHKNESRQLASRIVQHIRLAPLTQAECTRYVDFRIARAGSDGRIRLSRQAQTALYRHARGNPRRVHLIMDRCLYGVAPAERHEIGKRLVDMAAGEGGIAQAPRHAWRRWMVAGGTGLALGLAAWTGMASPGLSLFGAPAVARSAAVARVPAASSAPAVPAVTAAAPAGASAAPQVAITAVPLSPPRQAFQDCLKNLRAEAWRAEIEDGLNIETRQATLRALAENGLVLALLPAGLRLPEPSAAQAGMCHWDNRAGNWVLWRPAHLPFALVERDRGDAVRWLQQQLAATNFYSAPVDGRAGPRTLAALRSFRQQHGMPADGSVDAWTLFLLEHGPGKLAG